MGARLHGAERFNPRPREGATTIEMVYLPHEPVSIHAPVRGRLGRLHVNNAHATVSIHAPVRGRLEGAAPEVGEWMFQSTPP